MYKKGKVNEWFWSKHVNLSSFVKWKDENWTFMGDQLSDL